MVVAHQVGMDLLTDHKNNLKKNPHLGWEATYSQSQPHQAEKDQDGSWAYKTKKKTTKSCQLGKVFILDGKLSSRAVEGNVDKMGFYVVWNSVSQRTFVRYDKIRLIDATAIYGHLLYRIDKS